MTDEPDVFADLDASTDIMAARLNSLLLLVAALPDGIGDAAKAAAAELAPFVSILQKMGSDAARPVPTPAELPRTDLPAATLAPSTMPDGEGFPTPQNRSEDQ